MEYVPIKKFKPSRIALFDENREIKRIPKRTPESGTQEPFRHARITVEAYSSLVRSRVLEKASEYYPRSKAKGNVYVAFDVLSNGSIKGSPRILGRADESLEMLAVKSVYEASPFPPFPPDLRKPEETFKVLLSYR